MIFPVVVGKKRPSDEHQEPGEVNLVDISTDFQNVWYQSGEIPSERESSALGEVEGGGPIVTRVPRT